jgi:Fe-S-cluster containining protein
MSTKENGSGRAGVRHLRVLYNCLKCPAYCCSYDRISVTQRDVARLAAYFGISYQQAEQRFTKIAYGERVLRHKKDHIFKKVCQFLDPRTRRCTVYEARPAVCRQYPEGRRCGYYDFLMWERQHQGDEEFIPSA